MSRSREFRPSDDGGREWLVDAAGCEPRRLADLAVLRDLLNAVVADLELRPIGSGVWHQFPEPGGITGMLLLSESHLTCHTWPESGTVAFNLFCCRPRPEWIWEEKLREFLGARSVVVRLVERGPRKGAGA
jgi:S-adenosylmethionine decarboxylase